MALNSNIDNNTNLVEQCRLGNIKAQSDLYNQYAKAMYNVGLRIVLIADDAKDVLQDAFIEAFTKIESFRGESTFGAWLKTIVVNKALTKIKSKRLVFEEISDQHVQVISEESHEDEFDESEKTIANIKIAMGLLPVGYRLILNLYLFEGYDHLEISQILSISESTSRSQFLRGKNKLIEILKSNF